MSFTSLRRLAVALAGSAALLLPAVANAGSTKLTLINGWKNAPFSTSKAEVSELGGVVHFKGAIATGKKNTNTEPFILPEAFRPASMVYAPVDMCDATKGRLIIYPSGNVTVQAATDYANAQCFTSLDGASYALTSDSFKPLTLKNGWSDTEYGTGHPALRVVDGVVHFEGAMSTENSNTTAFKLPTKYRPLATVYIPVDMCAATNGRLIIDTDGTAVVEAESDFGNAQCFTSLEGANYALSTSGYTPLSLVNGWSNYGTRDAAARVSKKIVQFEGAIATNGSDSTAFVLPAGMRPSTEVYVNVDLCNATKGRLHISPDGSVSVQAETDFANAQCFTSLEGASFHL